MIKQRVVEVFGVVSLVVGGLLVGAQTLPATRPAGGAASRAAIVYDNTPPIDPDLLPRELVDACLKSPRVWVMNPPPDRDPYGDLSIAERIEKQVKRMQAGGAVLLLFPDGQPAQYRSGGDEDRIPGFRGKSNVPMPGAVRQWYADGSLMLAEDTTAEGLQTARYHGPRGEVLGKIEKGDGIALVMAARAADRIPGTITGTRPYKNGKLHGGAVTYADYAAGSKWREETYSEGLLEGPTLHWADGWLNTAEIYHAGIKQEAFMFDSSGRVTHSDHFSDGMRSTGPAEGNFDPAPYKQRAFARPATQGIRGFSRLMRETWPKAGERDAGRLAPAAGTAPATRRAPAEFVAMWSGGDEVWGVRPSDAATALSTDRGQTWEVRTSKWEFEPRMLGASVNGVVAVWGVVGAPAADGRQASRVAISRDKGVTWRTVAVPIDIALGMTVDAAGTVSIGGKYLPKAGMKVEHWFLLPDWRAQTSTGNGWTKLGIAFEGPPTIVEKFEVKGGTVWIAQSPGFLDPGGFSVYLVASQQAAPRSLARTREKPRVVVVDGGASVEIYENKTVWKSQRESSVEEKLLGKFAVGRE